MKSPRIEKWQSGGAYTLVDLIVVIAGGILPGLWLSTYFPEKWQPLAGGIITIPFGVAVWCLIFLGFLPFIKNRRKNDSDD